MARTDKRTDCKPNCGVCQRGIHARRQRRAARHHAKQQLRATTDH